MHDIVGNSPTLLVESGVAQLISVRKFSPIELVFLGEMTQVSLCYCSPYWAGLYAAQKIWEPVHFVCSVIYNRHYFLICLPNI